MSCTASPAGVELGGWRGVEIKDEGRLDKDVARGHALSAHLLREEAACYTWSDLGSDKPWPLSEGTLRRGRKEFDEGRGPGSRRPRPCPWAEPAAAAPLGSALAYGYRRHDGVAQGLPTYAALDL